jgi:hypothetical protein
LHLHLLVACRLKALPADVLPTIARKAGRPARRACRLLSDAHGPLACGLRLDGVSGARELLAMAALRPRRFDHITSLVLARPNPAGQSPLHPTGRLPPLYRALPSLSSLCVAHHVDATDLAGLAALAPRLTALTLLRPAGGDARLSNLLALTGLHSLAIPLLSWALQTARHEGDTIALALPRVLQALGSLSCLRALKWLDEEEAMLSPLPAATIFTPLGVLRGLTSLQIRPGMGTWDQGAVDTLRTGFPELSTLALHLRKPRRAIDPAVITALAQRTALTSLQLTLSLYSEVGRQSLSELRRLSTLPQLGHLSVEAEPGVEQILQVLSPATALTSLHLGGYYPHDADTEAFCALSQHLKELTFVSPTFSKRLLDMHMGCLPLVTRLRLVDVALVFHDSQQPLEGYGRPVYVDEPSLGLGQASSLEVLEVSSRAFGGGGGNLEATLHEIAGLSRLRDFTLTVGEPYDVTSTQADFRDVHLMQLAPLCNSLTRLVLGGIGHAGGLLYVEGAGLGVVGRLTRLRQLKLFNMAVLENPCLHEYLLPLPASLRRLELGSDGVLPGVQASLQAAARGQDCAVRFGSWVL